MTSILTKNQYDVIIVGGGIVGATAACSLAMQTPELSIALLDASSKAVLDLSRFDARVVALSRESERIYHELHVWQDVAASRACAYTDMHVWDGDGTAEIHFDAKSIHENHLGHIVENSVLVDALQNRLAAFANVECEYGVKVTAYANANTEHQRAELTLDNAQKIYAPIVIAADGAKSNLRELAGMPTREWDYGHSAIVTTVTTEKPHQYTAWQRFTTDGPIAFLPLSKNENQHLQQHQQQQQNQSSLVWSITAEKAESLMALADQEFCEALSRAFENTLGCVTQCDARYCFPLSQRHATHYHSGNLVLVGDAAHVIHPLAGQGANLGIYDAVALAKEISRAHHRSVPLNDESIFKRYERVRQGHNLATMAGMEGFKRLFGSDDLFVRWLRNEGLRQVDRLPFLKNALVSMATSPKSFL